VVAVDGESNGQREQGGATERCPEQQTPVLETFATKNAETEIVSKKSICRAKIVGVSLSNPTMNPPCRSSPARWMRFTSAIFPYTYLPGE
jgi:hypothetical protein